MEQHEIILPGDDKVIYWTAHESKKPPLILVHGFTGSHAGFQYLVPLLTDFHLIIPDLPGFGVSPLPHEELDLQELGKLLIEFIEVLQLEEPPHLLGHSMGSLVVAEAVKQRPDIAARKLILGSPVPTPVGWIDTRRGGAVLSQFYYGASHRLPRLATSRRITKLSTKTMLTTADKELQVAIHGHHYDNLNYISSIRWYGRLYRQINRTGISHYADALKKFDVLVISGDKDTITPIKHQRKAVKKVGAKLKVIPRVGHLAHYETPKQLADAIADFLR